MWEEIARKWFSWTNDDMQQDTVNTALVEIDPSTYKLRLRMIVKDTGPYVRGGSDERETVTDIGTITKPNLGLVLQKTGKPGAYYKFPRNWEGVNKANGSLGDILKLWARENMTPSVSISDDEKRQQISDALSGLSGAELDRIRSMLRIGSKDRFVASELLKVSAILSSVDVVTLKPLPVNTFMTGIQQDYMIYFRGNEWGKLYFNMRGYVAEKGIPIPSDRTPNGVVGLSIGEKSISTYRAEIRNANRIWNSQSV